MRRTYRPHSTSSGVFKPRAAQATYIHFPGRTLFTQQAVVAATHYILIAAHFTYPKGMEG